MSQLNRKKLKRMILNEMSMMGMTDMPAIGDMSSLVSDDMGMDDHDYMSHGHEDRSYEDHASSMSVKGSLSREQCCAAIMCLLECCSCEYTKNKLMSMCQSIMSGEHSSFHSA